MKTENQNYDLFFKFIQTFAPGGFKNIDPNHPLVLELEEIMEQNNQFFWIGDMLQIKILWTSKRSTQMMGIPPEEISPYHFFEATHPDDLKRHSLGRSMLFKLANDLYVEEKGFSILSTNIRLRNPLGLYTNMLLQLYLYYSTVPYKSVFTVKVHTNIDWCKKIKHGYHYYVGNDMNCFRFPDNELLMMGNVYSSREFEIIKLIELGLTNEQITEKLFISINTLNTHRRNILAKSGKKSISDLIYYLIEHGVL
jgi:DNA-binding CsgD family transcriptional regulator